ncbi:jerky protein homolog [Scylla paramamosain]
MKATDTPKAAENRHTLQYPRGEMMDKVLYKWFSLKRSERITITGPMLQEKGRDLAKNMGEEGACQFSDGWLHRFKVRHGIRKLDISGESKSANLPSAEEFVDRFAKIVEEHNLTSEQIYNADETGLFYRCLPRTTLASESEQTC